MLGLVVHPGPVEEALRVAEAEVPAGRIGDVVLPSKTLTAAERVGIYHGMYPLRMTEALQSDYPALAHYLGDDGFRDLVRGYVQAFPSRSYTLNSLGDHLPEYVKTAPGVRRPEFCHDLARLERRRYPRRQSRPSPPKPGSTRCSRRWRPSASWPFAIR